MRNLKFQFLKLGSGRKLSILKRKKKKLSFLIEKNSSKAEGFQEFQKKLKVYKNKKQISGISNNLGLIKNYFLTTNN